MELVSAFGPIVVIAIGFVVLYFVVRTAVFDALRKHSVWLEDRAARPEFYDPDKPLRGPVPPDEGAR